MTLTRSALVTGANRGIGLAIARALVARGLRVIASTRRAGEADAAARAIGGDTVGVGLDLSDATSAREEATAIEQAHGPIDVLVNNAGILTSGDGLEIDTDQLVASLTVNAVAPFALMQVLGRPMQARGWGRIVNVSSGWGAFAQGLAGPTAYAVSKATLNALTVSLARALGPAVKVNAASPGWVRTRMGGPGATRSVEDGADTPVWLATLPDDGPTGGLFERRRQIDW